MKVMLKNFRFSPTISIIALVLITLMLNASAWQWDRYKFKKDLEATYAQNSTIAPLPFPVAQSANSAPDFSTLMNRKVEVSGRYDYDKQILIRNRRHHTGPGYWLITPLHIENSPLTILVSRGFIPFADGADNRWRKYDFATNENLSGVIQASVPHRTFLSPRNPEASLEKTFVTHWLYPDIENAAKQLPYPTITDVYIQRLGLPPQGDFPAEAVSIAVPPSTHFGYTFEWIILALVTFAVAIWLQANPRKSRMTSQIPSLDSNSRITTQQENLD